MKLIPRIVSAASILALVILSAPLSAEAVPPAVLTVECGTPSNPYVILTWDAVAGATTNGIIKNVDGGNGVFVSDNPGVRPPPYTYTYNDLNVFAGHYYDYRVKTDAPTASNMVRCDFRNTAPTTCQDPAATNYGGPLPCQYAPTTCQDPTALNYGGSLPCEYGPSGAPLASTLDATEVTTGAATLNGEGNPAGKAAEAWFEYGRTNSLGLSTGAQAIGSGSSDTRVRAQISGLTANANYYFRLVVRNTHGLTRGEILSFTTDEYPETEPPEPPPPWPGPDEPPTPETPPLNPLVSVEPTSRSIGVGQTASFRAYYDSDGVPATPRIDVTALASWQSSNSRVATSQGGGNFRGVGGGATRVVASYNGMSAAGRITVASAPGQRPSAKTRPATGVTKNYATLQGLVNPNGYDTKVWFEFGKSEELGKSSKSYSIGSDRSWKPIALEVGVVGETTYYYRVAAQSSLGSAKGEILKLSSLGSPTLMINPPSQTLGVDDSAGFKIFYDPDGSGPKATEEVTRKVSWISRDTGVAFHENAGNFRGVGPGEATVTAYFNPAGQVTNIYDIGNMKAESLITVFGKASQLTGGSSSTVSSTPEEAAPPSASGVGTWFRLVIVGLFGAGVLAGMVAVGFYIRRKLAEREWQ